MTRDLFGIAVGGLLGWAAGMGGSWALVAGLGITDVLMAFLLGAFVGTCATVGGAIAGMALVERWS